MGTMALLLVGEAMPGERPPGLGIVGGISLVERQMRMALKAGCESVLLLGPALPAEMAERIAAEGRCHRLSTAAELAAKLATEDRTILLFAPGLVADERIVAAMVQSPLPLFLAAFADPAPAAAERLDSGSHWAGLARMPARLVAETASGIGDWELSGTLLRAAIEQGAPRFAVQSIPLYAPLRRREVPLLWAIPRTQAEHEAAGEELLAGAQKGCLDWPARFIHPPIENWMVRRLLPTPISPNMITLGTAVLGFIALWMFAVGYLWPALILVLIVGPLDGIDGKLARTRHQFSRWGDLEHVVDKVLEYGWVLALAYYFAQSHGVAAWLTAGGIISFALAEAASGEFFRRFSGRQLDDWGPFERGFRVIGGRRNTFFWTLIPFAAFGAWWAGFLMILFYAAITFAISHWRLLKAIGEYGRQTSDEIRLNFDGTAYDFLPKSRSAGR